MMSVQSRRAFRSLSTQLRVQPKQFPVRPKSFQMPAKVTTVSFMNLFVLASATAVGLCTQNVLESTDKSENDISNWSGTHTCYPTHIYEPESVKEAIDIVARHHKNGTKLRPIGSGLSPNGIGFCKDNHHLLNMAHCDKIIEINKDKKTVTVEAGIKVGDLCEELQKRQSGLTLQNLASIAEQQVGGFIQVGAHGTGANIPPVDMQVVSMKIITPALGILQLSDSENKPLFDLAKVGLGCLGVVAEVTLQCVEAHDLLEHTFTVSREWAKENHAKLLKQHKHVRYMWVPYTDTVVVVTNDPVPSNLVLTDEKGVRTGYDLSQLPKRKFSKTETTEPMRSLLLQTKPELASSASEVNEFGLAQLRDHLLAIDPLNSAWIRRVNEVEAKCWERSESYNIGRSCDLLQFDCGGQQWVSEVCFPAGSLETPTYNDMEFMQQLLELIEQNPKIAAPSPIEQRWTANSSSSLSPACATLSQQQNLLSAASKEDTMHSWVGIIMYLPPDDEKIRSLITESFNGYKNMCAKKLWRKYDAVEHWAKIEVPDNEVATIQLQQRLAGRYPTAAFNKARDVLDPKNILGNPKVDTLLSPLRMK